MRKPSTWSRREFLRSTRNIAVGLGVVGPNIFLNRTKAVSGQNPSEFIRIGFIGVGGQGNSNLLRFSVIDDTGTSVALKKGDVAVTLGSLFEPYPHGLVIGTVVHEVGAGGAIARDAELRPIVDLDSLNLVKVLKYVPATIP